jgi:2-polyprenyl-3-methyl-5-hydroxy-6-metoxy-1,4-benzoquinol methylase
MTTIEQTDLPQTDIEQPDVDAAAVEEFAAKLIETITGGLITCLIEIGRRVGLFELAAAGPATSAELAERGGLQERYVREWLAAMSTAGIVEYDADNGRFWLPVEHAAVLTGDSYDNLAPVAYLASVVIRQSDAVAECFTEGGGVPWAAYLPEMHDVMDVLWQPMYRDLLVQQILPLAPGLIGNLESGIRVADVACGSGNGTLVLARRFPNSRFVGFDLDTDAIAIARSRVAGLHNVSFEVADAATLSCSQPFGAAFVFNSVHDQAQPFEVLSSIQSILEPGGTFLMNEPRISSNLEDNIDNPVAPMTYAISLLHCMTVSLAEGGAGLGTGWGEQVALRLLADAGFSPVEVHDPPATLATRFSSPTARIGTLSNGCSHATDCSNTPRPHLRAWQTCATPLSRLHRPCARWFWTARTLACSPSSIDNCWAFDTGPATNHPPAGRPTPEGRTGWCCAIPPVPPAWHSSRCRICQNRRGPKGRGRRCCTSTPRCRLWRPCIPSTSER